MSRKASRWRKTSLTPESSGCPLLPLPRWVSSGFGRPASHLSRYSCFLVSRLELPASPREPSHVPASAFGVQRSGSRFWLSVFPRPGPASRVRRPASRGSAFRVRSRVRGPASRLGVRRSASHVRRLVSGSSISCSAFHVRARRRASGAGVRCPVSGVSRRGSGGVQFSYSASGVRRPAFRVRRPAFDVLRPGPGVGRPGPGPASHVGGPAFGVWRSTSGVWGSVSGARRLGSRSGFPRRGSASRLPLPASRGSRPASRCELLASPSLLLARFRLLVARPLLGCSV